MVAWRWYLLRRLNALQKVSEFFWKQACLVVLSQQQMLIRLFCASKSWVIGLNSFGCIWIIEMIAIFIRMIRIASRRSASSPFTKLLPCMSIFGKLGDLVAVGLEVDLLLRAERKHRYWTWGPDDFLLLRWLSSAFTRRVLILRLANSSACLRAAISLKTVAGRILLRLNYLSFGMLVRISGALQEEWGWVISAPLARHGG